MSKAENKTTKTNKPAPSKKSEGVDKAKEVGGRSGPEPTRYGDWEKNGIISDF